jgi:hypothetical protein
MACPAQQYPTVSTAQVTEVDTQPAELTRIAGRCPACGISYSGFIVTDTGVIQVDRVTWRAVCPWAARLQVPGACRELQSSFCRTKVPSPRSKAFARS